MKKLYDLAAITIISCLGLIVYSNTFYSSFHFDDEIYIVNNYFIRNIHNLLNGWMFYPCRFITFLSIVVNYHFNGLNVFGYHAVNLVVHITTAILVWWLTLLTLSTPAMKENRITQYSNLIALFVGLVFVSHPLQTEAVTYIWQRAASMAAMFYLASLCFYIKSRLGVRIYYFGALLTAVLAMFTKENTVTLPLMILFYEFIFFEGKKNWSRLLPFLCTIFIIPLTMAITKAQQFQAIQKFVQGPGGTSPLHYLLTQFKVVTLYIRLVFLPLNQNLDHDYSISKSIFELHTLFGFLLIITILVFAIYIFRQYRLMSFAIIWFFLTLLPESSFFPLKNPVFEHRLYLPLVGYSLFLVSGLYYLLGKNTIKWMVMALSLIVVFNSILTYQRNMVWRNELTLWDDAVRKSPHRERPYNNRGFAYYKEGRLKKAIADYNRAINIDPKVADAYLGRGLSYASQGDFSRAISDYNKAIEINPNYADAFNNRGIFYFHQGDLSRAVTDLTKGIDIDPNNAKAYYNRGLCFAKQDDFTQAVSDYNKAITIDPNYADAYYNRGLIFAQQNYFTQAIIDFNKTTHIKPDYADAYNNLGIIYATQGNFAQAISNFDQAIKIAPNDTEAYNNEVNVYYMFRKYDDAWGSVHEAQKQGVSIDPQLINVLKTASAVTH